MRMFKRVSGPMAAMLCALPLYGAALPQHPPETPNAPPPHVQEARTRPTPGEDGVVEMDKEPRHHLVYQGDGFQVLDISFPPGDTTLFHLHDAPMFYVAVSSSVTDAQVLGGEWLGARAFEAPAWLPGEVDTNISYAEKPLVHRVKNVGSNLFRLIGVANKRPRPDSDTLADGLPGEAEIQNAWFQQSRASVAPGKSAFIKSPGHPVVVVQTSPGSARIRLTGSEDTGMHSAGEFVVVEPGQELELVNAGDAAMTMVFIAVQ